VGSVFSALGLFGISKTDAARITKRDTEMFHDESLKPIYFEDKRSLPAWVIVSAGIF